MQNGLALGIIIASLLVGGACLYEAARDRFITLIHLGALALVELAVLVQAVLAIVAMVGGDVPQERLTFIGYLIVAVLFLPAAIGLALMERTRWGSLIVGGGAVVTAVLVLRLMQVWTPLR